MQKDRNAYRGVINKHFLWVSTMSQAFCQALYKYAPLQLHQNIRTDRIVEAKFLTKVFNQRSDHDQLLQQLNLSVLRENYSAFLKKILKKNPFLCFAHMVQHERS